MSACCGLSTVLGAWVLRAGSRSRACQVLSAKWEEMQPETSWASSTVADRKPEVR